MIKMIIIYPIFDYIVKWEGIKQGLSVGTRVEMGIGMTVGIGKDFRWVVLWLSNSSNHKVAIKSVWQVHTKQYHTICKTGTKFYKFLNMTKIFMKLKEQIVCYTKEGCLKIV